MSTKNKAEFSSFTERINYLIGFITTKYNLNNKEIAERLNISNSALSFFKTGRTKTTAPKTAAFLQKEFNVNLNWLKSGEGEPFLDSLSANGTEITNFNQASDFIIIPLLDLEVGAGAGIEVNGETKSKGIDFSSGWIRSQLKVSPKDLVAVTVDGDSMSPVLRDKSIILVDQSQKSIKNGLVYVFRQDNSLLVKRLELLADGSIIVKSDNPEYQKATFKREDFDQLNIIGRVIWQGGEI